MAQTKDGAVKVAAVKTGNSLANYLRLTAEGFKWCSGCHQWHARAAFGSDASRFDGLSAHCLDSRKTRFYRHTPIPKELRRPMGPPRHQSRSGDKRQARHHVNLSVRMGEIPAANDLPCFDCAHLANPEISRERHEYDHHRGYGAEHHYDVQAVCVLCHHAREMERGTHSGLKNKKGGAA